MALLGNGEIKKINQELIDIISKGEYVWYFLNMRQTETGIVPGTGRKTQINLYGYKSKPDEKYLGKSGLGIFNAPGGKCIYEKEGKRWYNRRDLDPSIRRYTAYNRGAEYKPINESFAITKSELKELIKECIAEFDIKK